MADFHTTCCTIYRIWRKNSGKQWIGFCHHLLPGARTNERRTHAVLVHTSAVLQTYESIAEVHTKNVVDMQLQTFKIRFRHLQKSWEDFLLGSLLSLVVRSSPYHQERPDSIRQWGILLLGAVRAKFCKFLVLTYEVNCKVQICGCEVTFLLNVVDFFRFWICRYAVAKQHFLKRLKICSSRIPSSCRVVIADEKIQIRVPSGSNVRRISCCWPVMRSGCVGLRHSFKFWALF